MGGDDVDDELKMVFVVRSDLNMSGGKVAAQVAHAVHRLLQKGYCATSEYKQQESVDVRTDNQHIDNSYHAKSIAGLSALQTICAWEQVGCKKITLQTNSYDELLQIRKKAKQLDTGGFALSTATIRDAGHTEIPPGTWTVLGLGPHKSSVL